jgi:predicted HTH transcriptional regulator
MSAPIGGSDRDRKEFLADVSAFANPSGGDIVIGIEEDEGVAGAAQAPDKIQWLQFFDSGDFTCGH